MQPTNEFVEIFPDAAALTQAAGRYFVRLAQEAVAARGVFTVALSGGTSPKGLYRLLAADAGLRGAIPWGQTHFFFTDERHVPPDNAESNFRMANEALFQLLPAGATHVHRIPAELPDAGRVALEYADDLAGFFPGHGRVAGGFPRFDFVLLGMGADGHTASLFPGTAALGETQRWVAANWVEKLKTHRITLTFPVLNNAAAIILFVAGPDKAPMVAEVLERTADAPRYPVQLLRPSDGTKRWMLDQAAAAQITRPHPAG